MIRQIANIVGLSCSIAAQDVAKSYSKAMSKINARLDFVEKTLRPEPEPDLCVECGHPLELNAQHCDYCGR